MSAELKPRVVTKLEIPEGTPSSPLLEVWKIADEGRIASDKFAITFEREIGPNNEPVRIYINVYGIGYSAPVGYLGVYTIEESGLVKYSTAGTELGVPNFEKAATSLSREEKAEKMVREGLTVVEFVKTIKTSAPEKSQYQI